MKVYCVVGYGNENFDLNSIYDNKKIAELKSDQLNKDPNRHYDLTYGVDEYEVIEEK